MNRIGLKVNGIWCVLPQDVSISIEEQNPLFSDSGSYSYPIELSVSQNRELFKSIDSPHGRIRPQDIDGLPFELWFDGNMLLSGSIETDEDLDIDEDKCSINLVSGNGDFKSKIEGMQCTDVPLLGEVHLGYSWTNVYLGTEPGSFAAYKWDLDEQAFMEYTNANVSYPYDANHPYCNVRICVKNPDPETNKEKPYIEYDADRPWSGVCFYVAYFLDCLFKHIGVIVKENNMGKVEDMSRLAFFTTKCEHEYGLSSYPETISSKKPYLSGIDISKDSNISPMPPVYFTKKEVYATNKNFPQEDVSNVVDSLFNAFGLKIVSDTRDNSVRVVYIRDVLRDNDVVDVPIRVNHENITYQKVNGVSLGYSGDDKDTAFNYNDYSRVITSADYSDFIGRIHYLDKNCYVSTLTGNKYRIKNDGDSEDSGDLNNLNPSLFEVAQYTDYIIGKKDSAHIEELKIGFTPIIENDINFKNEKDGVSKEQRLAIYIDEEMKAPQKVESYYYQHFLLYSVYVTLTYNKYENYDMTNSIESPLRTRDSGFTLGVMRGPGNDSAVQVYLDNYDGNGNDAWTTVVADYAFTADTMDAYGNRYDYNGKEDGGVVDRENSVSLKTHIVTSSDVDSPFDWGVDSDAAKRGLADRFMSEYMQFILNRKIVSMGIDTTFSQLTSLSWFKQLRINNTVGRLKSRKYTLSNNGVSDMGIELYTIN